VRVGARCAYLGHEDRYDGEREVMASVDARAREVLISWTKIARTKRHPLELRLQQKEGVYGRGKERWWPIEVARTKVHPTHHRIFGRALALESWWPELSLHMCDRHRRHQL
jgi:hypothetical protein